MLLYIKDMFVVRELPTDNCNGLRSVFFLYHSFLPPPQTLKVLFLIRFVIFLPLSVYISFLILY